jgi:hypothetical protein
MAGPWQTRPNKFFLGGLWSPGVCAQPKGAAIVRNLDERVGVGIDYAFVVFTGRKLARFTTELILVTKQDYIDYLYFYFKLIQSVPLRGARGTTAAGGYDPAKSLSIWHPQLLMHDITQCVVEEEPQIDYDDKGAGHVPIKFCQTKPKPSSAYSRPEAAAAKPPLSGDELEIDRLNKIRAAKRQANEAAGR